MKVEDMEPILFLKDATSSP